MKKPNNVGEEAAILKDHLSDEQIVALAETYGGTRLYVPIKIDDDHELILAVGRAGYEKLRDAFARDSIRVPLCRALRAKHYRARGLSNGRIATRLGITEPGVNKLFQRLIEGGEVIPLKGSLGHSLLTPSRFANGQSNVTRPRSNVQDDTGTNL